MVGLALAVGWFALIPRLDSFTEGALEERFSDTTTGRTDLAVNDVEIFGDNILFGVGPGMTKYQRLGYDVCQLRNDDCVDEASSHTEFTRSLSEHGLVGVVALGFLVAITLQAFRRQGPDRVLAVTLLLWAMAQMAYANLRVVAVPLAFALAFVRVGDDPDAARPDVEPDDRQSASRNRVGGAPTGSQPQRA